MLKLFNPLIVLNLILLLSFTEVTGQEMNTDINLSVTEIEKPNELRINLLLYSTILDDNFYFYSIDYERILSPKSSIGFSFGGRFIFGSTETYSDIPGFFSLPDIAFMPYYRDYFSNSKIAAGLFAEINSLFTYYKYNYINKDGIDEGIQPSFGFGLGAAVGYKHLAENNFSLEFIAGIGFNSQYLIYPRIGIIIGHRY
ncbi:hypothetical protein [Polaribacter uvawellassae]|uniref:hypothetical protein n=1 Tax=Polaribacter uvawellassae TaxID=3133495 RepID=UPI00321B8A7F